MKKYPLLLFIIIYISMCQLPVYEKKKQDSSVKNTVIVDKKTSHKIVKKQIKVISKPTTEKVVKKSLPKHTKIKTKKKILIPPSIVLPKKEMTKEEYFEKMFGKKHMTNAVKDLIVPLVINKKFARNTRFSIIGGKQFIQSQDLKMVLIHFLPQKLLTKIFNEKNIVNNGIDIKLLHAYGIDSYFDEEDLAIYISISPKVRIPTKLKFSNNRNEMDEAFEAILKEKSTTVSGASNFYIRDTFSNSLDPNELDRKAATLKNQTFVNYHDYIINSGFVLNEQKSYVAQEKKSLFHRNPTYLSKDFPRENTRIKVGDISLLGLDKMGNKDILGISLVKHYDITKRMQTSIQVTEKEIFLKNESQMEVYINDRLVRTITLQPGVHLLSDFPLISGRNNVKIKLHDIFGETKEIDFSDFYYYELLKEGVSTYGISAGIGLSNGTNGVDYNSTEQLFSAFYNHGITKDFTLNTGLQATNDLIAYENQFYYGSSYGLFSGFGIVSKTADFDYGYKYGYGYTNVIDKTTIGIRKEFIDSNYKNIVSDFTSDLSSESLSVSMGTSFGNGVHFTASYTDKYSLASRNQSYNIGYNQRLTSEWNVQLDFKNSKIDSAPSTQNTMLTLRYTPRKSRLSYSTTLEKEDQSSGGDINMRAAVDVRKDGKFGLDSTLEYENYENNYNRYALRSKYSSQAYTMNMDYSQTVANTGYVSKSGSINMSTAIAFVDDNFAITQPVSNSFILVKNDDFFTKEPLGIKTFNENSPTPNFVIPTSDYGVKKLTVDERDLMFGVDLKENTFEVTSKYKTGSVVHIEPKFILTVKGYLHDQNDKPLAMKVFKTFNVADDGQKTAMIEDAIFFTNNEGKFMIANIDEGNYFAQEINKESPYSFYFTTKNVKSGGGVINLGVIKAVKEPIIEKKVSSSNYIEINKFSTVKQRLTVQSDSSFTDAKNDEEQPTSSSLINKTDYSIEGFWDENRDLIFGVGNFFTQEIDKASHNISLKQFVTNSHVSLSSNDKRCITKPSIVNYMEHKDTFLPHPIHTEPPDCLVTVNSFYSG